MNFKKIEKNRCSAQIKNAKKKYDTKNQDIHDVIIEKISGYLSKLKRGIWFEQTPLQLSTRGARHKPSLRILTMRHLSRIVNKLVLRRVHKHQLFKRSCIYANI